MQLELNNERYLVNFPNNLFKDLVELNRIHECMDLDLAALIIHFIKKQQSEPQEWVKLYSGIMQKYDHGKYLYNTQINVLKESGVIDYIEHRNKIKGKPNSSRKYRINLKYFEKSHKIDTYQDSIKTYKLGSQPLLKRLNKHIKKRRIEARSSTEHLTKWLDSGFFSIKTSEAIDFINHKYDREVKNNYYKYLKRFELIQNFNTSVSYSRNGLGDRFDSIFTLLTKDLKPFVRYEDQKLVEVDIKSSQPLMFAILLERLLNHYDDLSSMGYGVTEIRFKNRIAKTLKNYINNEPKGYHNNTKYIIDIDKISYNITIILLKSLETPEFTEIRNFISLVKGGTVYESLGDFLLSIGAIWKNGGYYYTRLWNKIDSKQIETSFGSLRECSKKVLLNALYSRQGKGSINIINKVKEHFPIIFQVAAAFKSVEYEDFALILQRMEAKFILDFCSKNIAEKYPEMPLVCRHDSLSTTEEYGDIVFKEFQDQIINYFGQSLKLDKEIW